MKVTVMNLKLLASVFALLTVLWPGAILPRAHAGCYRANQWCQSTNSMRMVPVQYYYQTPQQTIIQGRSGNSVVIQNGPAYSGSYSSYSYGNGYNGSGAPQVIIQRYSGVYPGQVYYNQNPYAVQGNSYQGYNQVLQPGTVYSQPIYRTSPGYGTGVQSGIRTFGNRYTGEINTFGY